MGWNGSTPPCPPISPGCPSGDGRWAASRWTRRFAAPSTKPCASCPKSPPDAVTGIREAKAELRMLLRGIRAAIPPDRRLALALAVQARLFELRAYREAGTVLLFYSFGSEIPTAGIIQRSLDEGKSVFLPLLEAGGMVAAELKPGDSLAATTYGPKEPSNRVAIDPGQVGLVVAPGLGF